MQTSCFSFSRWNSVNRQAAGVIFEKEEMYKSTSGVVCGDMFVNFRQVGCFESDD